MHNIKILLFCWKLPSIPPPRGWSRDPLWFWLSLSNMASAQRFITLEEVDVLSFLHQNIARKLEIESQRQGLPKTHPRVLRAVIQHFNLGPTSHRNFDHLVWAIARGQ